MSRNRNDSPVAIFGRLLDPEKIDLSAEGANALLRVGFDEGDRDRMHELAVKSQEGTLTSDEQAELENYLLVGSLLNVMHARARQALSLERTVAAP